MLRQDLGKIVANATKIRPLRELPGRDKPAIVPPQGTACAARAHLRSLLVQLAVVAARVAAEVQRNPLILLADVLRRKDRELLGVGVARHQLNNDPDLTPHFLTEGRCRGEAERTGRPAKMWPTLFWSMFLIQSRVWHSRWSSQ